MAKTQSKPAPIIIKTERKFTGPGWNGQKVEPYIPPQPNKVFNPKK